MVDKNETSTNESATNGSGPATGASPLFQAAAVPADDAKKPARRRATRSTAPPEPRSGEDATSVAGDDKEPAKKTAKKTIKKSTKKTTRRRPRSRAMRPATRRLIVRRTSRRTSRRTMRRATHPTRRNRLRRRPPRNPPRNPPRRPPRRRLRSRQTRMPARETNPTTHRPVMPPSRVGRKTVMSRAAGSAVDVVGADDDASPVPATTTPMVKTTTIQLTRTTMIQPMRTRTTRPAADPHPADADAGDAAPIPHRTTNSRPTILRILSSKFVSHAIETPRTLADRRDWKPRSSADAKVGKPAVGERRS